MMKTPHDQHCLSHGDFISYLSGAVYAANKKRIEYHLSACCLCFEIFIDAFNRYLEQQPDEREARLGKNGFSSNDPVFQTPISKGLCPSPITNASTCG